MVKRSMTRIGFVSLFLGTVALRGVVMSQPIGSFIDVLLNNPEFSQLKDYAAFSGLDEVLIGDESTPTTFFAPSDTAFTTAPVVLSNLLLDEWNLHLQSFLMYHIAGQLITFNKLVDGSTTTLESLTDEPIGISVVDGRVLINGGPAAIVEGDILATNGVIHAIDNILTPSWFTRTFLDVLISDGSRFSTFVGIDTIGFFDEINLSTSSGPYTVFAPLNSGFVEQDLAILAANSPDYLRNVLGYHLVRGIYTGSDLTRLTELGTLYEGNSLKIEQSEDLRGLTVNGRLLVQSDILTNNGVVHVIAGVLTPLVDPEMEECSYLKSTEEMLGMATGVRCQCSFVDSRGIELTCTEGEGIVCSPKYAFCSDTVSCCTTSQRRCFEGRCRDSNRPERVKLGGSLGGAEHRTSGRTPTRNLRTSV
jgi:uncharacterized surface protein with fasciclin (FAS1) repeats